MDLPSDSLPMPPLSVALTSPDQSVWQTLGRSLSGWSASTPDVHSHTKLFGSTGVAGMASRWNSNSRCTPESCVSTRRQSPTATGKCMGKDAHSPNRVQVKLVVMPAIGLDQCNVEATLQLGNRAQI